MRYICRNLTIALTQILNTLAVLCILSLNPCQAQPFQLEMSVAKDTVSLGEPIVLRYKIVNPNSVQGMAYVAENPRDLGWKRESRVNWLVLKMTHATGQLLLSIADPFIPLRSGLYSGPPRRVDAPPQGYAEGTIVASQQFKVARAGTYRLDVAVKLPYQLDNEQDKQLLEKQFTFPITVTRLDQNRLRAVAESLRADVIGSSDGRRDAEHIQELFSMPEAHVYPVWQALANDPALRFQERDTIARQLVRVRSARAADLLTQMQWAPKQPLDKIGSVLRHLQDLHRNGDAALKQYIDRLLAAQGKTLPKRTIGLG